MVTLSGNCSGEVKMDGLRVCSNHWNNKHSQIVCQELDCGNAFLFKTNGGTGSDGYHVRCHGFESNLGQCETERGRCDGELVSVYCTGEYNWCLSTVQVNICDNGHYSGSFDKNLWRKSASFSRDDSLSCFEAALCIFDKSCKIECSGIYLYFS